MVGCNKQNRILAKSSSGRGGQPSTSLAKKSFMSAYDVPSFRPTVALMYALELSLAAAPLSSTTLTLSESAFWMSFFSSDPAQPWVQHETVSVTLYRSHGASNMASTRIGGQGE